jgi:hypothetical protein
MFIQKNYNEKTKYIYEFFNLKSNILVKRISNLILIPIDGLLKGNDEMLDIIDFYEQTVFGLKKKKESSKNSRIFSHPLFFSLNINGFENYILKKHLENAINEIQLKLIIHIIAHGEPSDFTVLDIGGYTIDSKSLAQKIIEELKEVNWKDKKIIFHFHTCDSATSPDYTEDSIKKYSLIGIFWNMINSAGYNIEVIGYPGLYCSLSKKSGSAVIYFNDRKVEKSKAVISINELGFVSIPKICTY